mmetsp:Transcript_65347/g.96691  ORF Transcript_65347/g.96691 Transcript_65347/m.96691 type:complete len:127 (-) Transcript_65347:1511-1891(-)
MALVGFSKKTAFMAHTHDAKSHASTNNHYVVMLGNIYSLFKAIARPDGAASRRVSCPHFPFHGKKHQTKPLFLAGQGGGGGVNRARDLGLFGTLFCSRENNYIGELETSYLFPLGTHKLILALCMD